MKEKIKMNNIYTDVIVYKDKVGEQNDGENKII